MNRRLDVFHWILLAALACSCVALGLSYIRKPAEVRPVCCPHRTCPYCKGYKAFLAGQKPEDNPFPQFNLMDPLHPRNCWDRGFQNGEREKKAQEAEVRH
jgi:hypothetical protein